MQVELYCPRCHSRFVAPPDTPAADIAERMTLEGPWFALGDGETFEDMIFSTLTSEGEIHCPECGELVHVSEESLGQLAMEVLGSW
jgi:DNA-directed RNA polymerase subunit RPC12/RpoP